MKKLNVVLDLDQTLISAEPTTDINLKDAQVKSKCSKFKWHDMDGYYVVFERPGLQKFLSFLFKNFNVSVWTAASKDYALFVIDRVILAGNNDRKLDYIFFSYHCDVSDTKKKGTKDLSMLWDEYGLVGYDKENTVIIDDYDEVYNTQQTNTIIAKPFEFKQNDSNNDDFLERLEEEMKNLTSTSQIPTINKNLSGNKENKSSNELSEKMS